MKWFKHMADTSRDSFVIRLEAQFGLEGYARWMKLIERIALEYEGAGADLALPVTEWCSFLKCKPKVLLLFLVHLQNENKIKMEQNGNVLKIEYPNIAKIQDDYRKKSGQTPEQLPKKSPLEVEGEEEEEGLEGKNTGAREPEQAPPQSAPAQVEVETIERVRIDLGTELMYDIGWASATTGNPAAVKTTVKAMLQKAGGNVADVVARLKAGADHRLRTEEAACSYVSEAVSGLKDLRRVEKASGAAGALPTAAPQPTGRRVLNGNESIEDLVG